jgi:(S)-ureidoglycine aminohydrolase
MAQQGLVGGRVVVERNHAILPPEGIPESVLPDWSGTAARVLAAPAMGARFAQYRLDLAPGGGTQHTLAPHIEGFFYVLAGEVRLDLNGQGRRLAPGGFAYTRPGSRIGVAAANRPASLLWLKKAYEPFEGRPPEDVVGQEADVKGEAFMGHDALRLQTLLPVDPAYDMAMNIFTFPPGSALPVMETHVMEHGLYMLEGQGDYHLGDRSHEVQAGDFIWMGPYCPQSFRATGATPARYLYYKNVHRDVEL